MDADTQFGEIALSNGLINKKQHAEAWKALRKLRKKYKGKRKKPRLVDVLVQKDLLTGRQARSVENARVYRQARMEDKLYGRIALKSKFVKAKQVEKALKAQKVSYLEGDELVRLSEYMLDKNWLTDEQDEAIGDALDGLDAFKYVGDRKKKRKGKAPIESDDDDDDDDDLAEIDSDEELDDDSDGDGDDDLEEIELEELDLDGGDPVESLDDADDAEDIDSEIENALSGLDLDLDLDLDDDDDDDDGSKPSEDLSDIAPPRGLSSDDLGDIEDELDDEDSDDEVSGLGSGIALDSEEVSGATSGSGSDLDLDGIDLDDSDL